MGILHILFLIVIKSVLAYEAYCPPKAVKSTTNNVCYVFIDIDSQFTNTLLLTSAQGHSLSDFWIGANLINITNDAGRTAIWVWEGLDKIVKFNDWGFKQPSNKGNCAAFAVNDGTWFADDCTARKYYVCSVPSVIDLCGDDWDYSPLTRACYKVFFDADWFTAETNCMKQSAHLASIHSFEENIFVQEMATFGNSLCNEEELLILGMQTETDASYFEWSDGSPADFYHWAAGEPHNLTENKCVAMYTNLPEFLGSYWETVPCDEQQHKYVCKKAPVHVPVK
uniref:C-type lectin domain-containing protein n=1 Tax=Panagrolaimus sp. JU765 TaxID=591449 RepID=A0AC34R4G8_9BILA